MLEEMCTAEMEVGFGRIVVSETEAPILLVKSGTKRMSSGSAGRQRDRTRQAVVDALQADPDNLGLLGRLQAIHQKRARLMGELSFDC